MTRIRELALAIVLVLGVPFIHAQADVSPATLTFTTIDVPGAMATVVEEINSAGQMVGYYYDSGNGATGTGFLLSGGNFTFFSYPGANGTGAFGINDSGLISGTAFIAQDTASVGFLYDGTTFTTISVRSMQNTYVEKINNASDVVGGDGGASLNQAFELMGTRFRNVTPPPGGWLAAEATGINNLGEIVGATTAASTNGFAFKNGKYQTLTFPGSGTLTTGASAVNDSGIIVGTYEACSPCGFHGFALMHGKYTSITYPGAVSTFANGINNAGEVVGSYSFDGQTFHGFVTSPINVNDQKPAR